MVNTLDDELKRVNGQKKEEIEKQKEREKRKVDFITNEIRDNYNTIQEYMYEKDISVEKTYNNVKDIFKNFLSHGANLTLEANEGKSIKKQDVKSFLPYKLGYYEIYKKKLEDFPEYFNHIALNPTREGMRKSKEYRNL